MQPRRVGFLLCCLAVLLASTLHGQPQLGNQLPNPRLRTLMPCGGNAGATFEVVLTGSDLEEPEALVFSHPGITATVLPTPGADAPRLAFSPGADAPRLAGKGQKQPPPLMPKFKVSIGANVPVGHYDVRMVGQHGISNARTFVVGDLAEVQEKEPNNDTNQAQRVKIDTTVTGTISQPDDVDYYVFAGKKGQRVLVQCQCASIDSRLTPEIKVVDRDDREIASHRAAQLTDGFVDVMLPEDADYKVRLVQSAHLLGGPELFYRLSITTGPWIDAVFPPMVEPGKTSQVTLYGRNLPGGIHDPGSVIGGRVLEKLTVTVTPPKDAVSLQRLAFSGNVSPLVATLDGFEYRVKSGTRLSNPVLLTYANAPLVLEDGPNDTPETAQPVPVPCEIAGRIDKLNDRDWYTFNALKGDVLMIELASQRLGAPTDLYMLIRNATGRQPVDMVLLDDNNETLHQTQFPTASRDPPPYRFVAPVDGRYQLMIGSHLAATVADVRQFYKVRITPEQPDFRLFVMPADTFRPDTCVLGAGGNQDLTLLVLRQDGFKGEIAVTVEGMPPGVVYKPQTIGPGMKQGPIVLNAALDAKPWTGTLTVKGTALIDGKKVTREARPASITWQVPSQSGIPAIARLERSLVLAVRGQAPYSLTTGIEKTSVIHGNKVTIPLKLTRHRQDFKGPVQVTPLQGELPSGVSFANVSLPPGKDEQNLVLNVPANVQPGTYTFVFRSFCQLPVGDPKSKAVNVVQCSTPVVLTVLPKQVAKIAVSTTSLELKPGTQKALTVKVVRLLDYKGNFTVKLLLPPEAKGISAAEVTIPGGQDEVRLMLSAAADAAPGPRNGLTIQVLATLSGMPLPHETKINVNVTK